MTHLQYLGFTHEGNSRVYRFRRIGGGAEAKEFVVNADLALFAKHRVALQEGPALSFQRLSAEEIDAPAAPSSVSLTEMEMLAHLATRPAASRSKSAGHMPKPPSFLPPTPTVLH